MSAKYKSPRKAIPSRIEKAVLAKSRRRCTLCFGLDGDVTEKRGQIAHLDGDRSNNAESNLAWMCLDHHSLFDSTTKQHKNYTITEVKEYRRRLYKVLHSAPQRSSRRAQRRSSASKPETAERIPRSLGPDAMTPAASPTPRPNLRIEAIKIGKIALHEDTWTNSPGSYSKGPLFRALLADVSNVPTESERTITATLKAAIRMERGGQVENYSLPWLEEYTNTVFLDAGARKVIVLAVGKDSQTGEWYFVLNHRNDYNSGISSAMDWTNMAPIPPGWFEILLIDLGTGSLAATFKYSWRLDPELNYPILKPLNPENNSASDKETGTEAESRVIAERPKLFLEYLDVAGKYGMTFSGLRLKNDGGRAFNIEFEPEVLAGLTLKMDNPTRSIEKADEYDINLRVCEKKDGILHPIGGMLSGQIRTLFERLSDVGADDEFKIQIKCTDFDKRVFTSRSILRWDLLTKRIWCERGD